MSSQLVVESGAQASEGISVVRLDVELLAELAVDCFNDLSHSIEQSFDLGRHLLFLVVTGQGLKAKAVFLPQLSGFRSTDVSFVAKDIQAGVLRQHFKSNRQVRRVGWRKLEIENHAA